MSGSAGSWVERTSAMGRNWKACMVSTSLWTLAITVAVGGTWRGSVIAVLWAVIVALVACMVTGWLVATCAASRAAMEQRLSLEHLAQIMASTATDHDLSNLR